MKFLSVTREDHVAYVKMDRPPANALSTEMIAEIDRVLDELAAERQIRSVLLYGEGRFFSAGADIKEFTQIKNGMEFSRLASKGQKVFDKIENYSKPVVAAIHGGALGGGLELAMACHIRLVSENATLGLPELQLGLIPGFAGTQRLPRYVGAAKAAEMLFTGQPVSGTEAVRLGLANQCFPQEELLDKAKEWVHNISKKSPSSLKAIIELLQYEQQDRFSKGAEMEAQRFGEIFETKDAQEGIRAFLEKREPKFTGE
ncbi:enoyl-CoA hydratase [Siminovitchia sediminis]|uniref:Enoyl-CoA hydratase n=1 Tax=Siminovitchia sediminis TaxID=1274353 RepID=A0ABW4KG53_9BACI